MNGEPAQVRVDQDLCTGDGLCVEYAPEVFEFDLDGLAYVRDPDGTLLTAAGARAEVPEHLHLTVLEAARDCPGECIYVESRASGTSGASGEPAASSGA